MGLTAGDQQITVTHLYTAASSTYYYWHSTSAIDVPNENDVFGIDYASGTTTDWTPLAAEYEGPISSLINGTEYYVTIIEVASGTSVITGWVSKTATPAAAPTLGTLTVSLTAGNGKVTLAPQTADTGYTFAYKSTATTEVGSEPAYGAAVGEGTWTTYAANADISGANGTEIFVQVVKVDSNDKIVAWGQASATPGATGTPSGDPATGDTGLTGVFSTTLYNLVEEVETQPAPGEEFAIFLLEEDGEYINDPITAGFYEQSYSLVTMKLGKIIATKNTDYLTADPGNDLYYAIGGDDVSYGGATGVYRQSAAFEELFDGCGGTFAFNTTATGHRYACVNSGATDAKVQLFTQDVYTLDSISVQLDSNQRLVDGNTVSDVAIAKIIGTYVCERDGTSEVTAELDTDLVTSVKFLQADGTTEENTFSSAVTQLEVTVTDRYLDDVTFTAVVDIVYEAPSNPPYVDDDPPAKTPETTPGGSVIVDGEEKQVAEVVVDEKSDTTTVIVDNTSFVEQIEAVAETGDRNVTIVVPAPENETHIAVAQLDVSSVEALAQGEMTLTVQSGDISYVVPAQSVDTAAILEALGAENSSDVVINVTINDTVDAETGEVVEAAIEVIGGEIVVPAITFTVTATYGDETVEIDVFDAFVSRTIEISAEDAMRITTALVIEADGTSRHVPTYVFEKDGKWYATINSMTNSTYVLIYNYQTFEDIQGKWYEQIVTEMASRKMVNGVSDTVYSGDRGITRAEFVSIMVRSLGLPDNGDASMFTDIPADAWYAGAVGTAFQYGLINGVTDTLFAPNDNITREEAMAIVYRTSKLTGYEGKAGSYQMFDDADAVSVWAEDAVAYNTANDLVIGFDNKLNPKADITRAETATVILRMLRQAMLVDDRS